ncbi:hypothetical protein H9P43_002515 [Blastocladiella emersonii ATCC 22665]|nr:hypothetical protein H9P43_002515 [Blastocladiella emersonii ATCC 22665]
MPPKRNHGKKLQKPTKKQELAQSVPAAPGITDQAQQMLRTSTFLTRASLRTIASRNAAALAGVSVAPPPTSTTVEAAADSRRSYSAPPPDFEAKYAEKLLERAKSQGFSSVQEMMDAYKQRRTLEEKEALKRAIEEEKAEAAKLASSIASSTLPPHVKPLKDIMHLDKLKDESAEVIEKLWVGFHANHDNISAVIPRDVYLTLHARAKKYPMFVLPVFRGEDAENYLMQHEGHQTFFTSLLAYKTHGGEAPVLLTLTYYTDLMESKGIVLVHGEGDTKQCPLETAKRLTQGMRNFYVNDEFSLVEQMYTSPNDFSFDSVLAVVKARMDAKKKAQAEEGGEAAAAAPAAAEGSAAN